MYVSIYVCIYVRMTLESRKSMFSKASTLFCFRKRGGDQIKILVVSLNIHHGILTAVHTYIFCYYRDGTFGNNTLRNGNRWRSTNERLNYVTY